MSEKSAEIFERLRHVLEQPMLYGTPERAAGIAMGLAAVWLADSKNLSVEAALRTVWGAAYGASSDIEPPVPEACIFLCDEVLIPERWTSFEALKRHGKIFMELLAMQ